MIPVLKRNKLILRILKIFENRINLLGSEEQVMYFKMQTFKIRKLTHTYFKTILKRGYLDYFSNSSE